MRSRRFDVKQAFRRLVAGQALGQTLYGFSCGPCPSVDYQPPDTLVTETEVRSGPLERLCSHVCGRRDLKCPEEVSDPSPLPVAFSCLVGRKVDGRDETESVPVDASTFGPAEREAWLTLSDLEQVKARAQPTAGAECYRICAASPASKTALRPASCFVAMGSLSCTPPLAKTLDSCGPAGRVPLGLLPARTEVAGELARFWLGTQHLEAASVFAFAELADTLEQNGAPYELVARCRSAAEEEREHARFAEVELRARGLVPAPVRRRPPDAPTLLDVALHNAAEGCVNESVAALLALHESTVHVEPSVRAFFREVAEEEAEHAQLAWDLHGWFIETLSADDARALVRHLDAAAARARRTPLEWVTLFDARERQKLTIGLVEQMFTHTREYNEAA